MKLPAAARKTGKHASHLPKPRDATHPSCASKPRRRCDQPVLSACTSSDMTQPLSHEDFITRFELPRNGRRTEKAFTALRKALKDRMVPARFQASPKTC